MSKKEFAQKLIQLDVKLKNTGNIPSENTIYAYLNGRIGIRVELIPYIAEVLNIPEQFLFDDSDRARKIFLTQIIKSMTTKEKEFLKSSICTVEESAQKKDRDRFYNIQDLLVYAPEMFLEKLESVLTGYKDLTLKFK
ncbi:hypothetical protein KKA17_09800 [bacterium]|nr:hypothetical protein [bacterium]MBU1884598.1 hypothetical protein [bacterium]